MMLRSLTLLAVFLMLSISTTFSGTAKPVVVFAGSASQPPLEEAAKAFEERFSVDFDSANSAEEKDLAESGFRSEIDRCRDFSSDRDSCESESGCIWS